MEIQKALVSNFPKYEESILNKTTILYPPQPLLITSVEVKLGLTIGRKELSFIYVGHDFYRKGGLAVLRCFERLSESYDNFKVTTIGCLRNDVPDVFGKDMEEDALRIIEKYNGTWLTHYHNLPNNKVMEMIKRSDIGLLPTYSDIFGYSCLEFQACGCPVISSDVRALPEINNDECGWVMEIGIKTKHRELANINDVIKTQEIEYKLEKVVEQILIDGSVPTVKIQKCIDRIAQYHSPERHHQILDEAYRNAVK